MQNTPLLNAQGHAKFEIFEIYVAEPFCLLEDHKRTLLIFPDSIRLARKVTKLV